MAKDDKDAKAKGGKDAKGDKDKGAKPAGKPAALDAKPAKQEKAAKAEKAAKPTAKEAAPTQPPRLKVHYQTNVVPALMKQFGYKSVMQVPRVTGPKMRVPIGSSLGFSNTAALVSNLITEPSGRRTPWAVRTTTAL